MDPDARRWQEDWVPKSWDELIAQRQQLKPFHHYWIRTLVRTPSDLAKSAGQIKFAVSGGTKIYLNGKRLPDGDSGTWKFEESDWKPGDLNLLVIGIPGGLPPQLDPPALVIGSKQAPLFDTMQMRVAHDIKELTVFPIPPQFGAPADLIQDWPTDLKD